MNPISTLATKAKLFVEKYPTLQKKFEQILNRMKFISFRVVKTTKRNENSTNNRARAIKKNKTKNTKMTHVLIYNDIVLDTPIYPCVCCERLNFLSKSILINEKAINQINNLLQHELKLIKEQNSYVCNFCWNFIKKGIIPIFCIPQNIGRNSIIESIKQFTVLEERMISPRLAFAQIHKLHNYGQYKLHGSIINVHANIDQTQSLLPRLSEDESTIGILLKRHLEYKSPYMSGNI